MWEREYGRREWLKEAFEGTYIYSFVGVTGMSGW